MNISLPVTARLRHLSGLAFAVLLAFSLQPAAQAEHRATRLGHPSTRFAPPLSTPDQLRTLLTNDLMQADVASILRQAGWRGNLADLRRAAATAEITEVKLPKGTRLPFMSARKDGKPVTLMDVLWVGDEPIEAYEFYFASAGRRYRCVTPKPCSNFLVIDLGPDLPALSLLKTAPAEASRCAPFPIKLAVRNISTLPLTKVRVTDALPAGLETTEHQTTLSVEVGDLAPGAGKEITFDVAATAAGSFVNRAEATSAEGAKAEAQTTTVVRAPALALECQAPPEVVMTRPAEICFTLRNTGDMPESGVSLALALPAGARLTGSSGGAGEVDSKVIWEIPSLGAGASQRLCAVLTLPQPGDLPILATARGTCAPVVETRCSTKVVGVPGVLVEVVDEADPIPVGDTVTYVIRVTNQGITPLTANHIVCTIPEEQEFVSGTGDSEVKADGHSVTMATLAVIESKRAATWRVVTKALSKGDARFKAAFTSDQFKNPIEEDESTTHY